MGQPSEMIQLGRLCPVKVFNPDAVGQRRRKGEKAKPVGDPIAHWKRYANGLPTVVFAAKVADSKDIVERYRAAGISAEHIDASTPDDERDAVFERSKAGKTLVISNVGVLVEGVDLPWLVCCQILRGCNSLVLWMQASGRVMRAFLGKLHGIILDHSGAAHEFNPPDWDFDWQLGDARKNAKANTSKDRKPITCPACGFVFSPKPICPECGKVMPQKRRKSALPTLNESGDGVLTEFMGQQEHAIKQDKLDRLWAKLLYIGKEKGWQMRRCAGVFSSQAGMPPWEAGLSHPLPFGKEAWSIPAAEWLAMNPTSGRKQA
jgi:superfamily II DNA or RNA helicase